MPKKPRTAYLLFANESREAVKAENPDELRQQYQCLSQGEGALSFGEVGKLLGEKWKALGEEEKATYKAKEAEDKERFKRECEALGIDPVAAAASEKSLAAAAAKAEAAAAKEAAAAEAAAAKARAKMPTRPRSAYLLYANDNREAVKAEDPSELRQTYSLEGEGALSFGEVGKVLGEKWKAVGEEEKATYKAKEAEDKERFKRECEALGIDPDKEKREAAEAAAAEKAAAAAEKAGAAAAAKAEAAAAKEAAKAEAAAAREAERAAKKAAKAAEPKKPTERQLASQRLQQAVQASTRLGLQRAAKAADDGAICPDPCGAMPLADTSRSSEVLGCWDFLASFSKVIGLEKFDVQELGFALERPGPSGSSPRSTSGCCARCSPTAPSCAASTRSRRRPTRVCCCSRCRASRPSAAPTGPRCSARSRGCCRRCCSTAPAPRRPRRSRRFRRRRTTRSCRARPRR